MDERSVSAESAAGIAAPAPPEAAPAGFVAVRGLCKSPRSGAAAVRVPQDLELDL